MTDKQTTRLRELAPRDEETIVVYDAMEAVRDLELA